MGQDKVRPDELGGYFVEILRVEMNSFPRIIETIKSVISDTDYNLDEDQVYYELEKLCIFAFHCVVFMNYKPHYEAFRNASWKNTSVPLTKI